LDGDLKIARRGAGLTQTAITGLAREIAEVKDLGRSLTDDEWLRPSGCEGWTVMDVFSHMACLWHGLVDPAASPLPEFIDVEAENEVPVALRRAWAPKEVLDEYVEYADGALDVLSSFQSPDVRDSPFDAKTLGIYPTHVLADALTFDHYAHLREDILAPLGPVLRPPLEENEDGLAAAMTWMTTGLPIMCREPLHAALDQPFLLRLEGPGGGQWLLSRAEDGIVNMEPGVGDVPAAATATSSTRMYVSWGTKRRDWRRCGLSVTGDGTLAARVLDAVNFV
jgi:uncharacterized protein (TIGR03083 family)